MSIQDATRSLPRVPPGPLSAAGLGRSQFPRPAGSLGFWREFQTTRARGREKVSRERVCVHTCVHEPGTHRAEAPCSCIGSRVRACGSPLKSGTKTSHCKEEITSFQKPGPDPEKHSPCARQD